MDSGSQSRSSLPRVVVRRGLVERVASADGSAKTGGRSLTRRSAAARPLEGSPAPSGRGIGPLGPVPAGAWLLAGLEGGPWREVTKRRRSGPHRRICEFPTKAVIRIIALGVAAGAPKIPPWSPNHPHPTSPPPRLPPPRPMWQRQGDGLL